MTGNTFPMKRKVRFQWWVYLVFLGMLSFAAFLFVVGISKLAAAGTGWAYLFIGIALLACFGYEAARFPLAYEFNDDYIVIRRLLFRDVEYPCSEAVGVQFASRLRVSINFSNKKLLLPLGGFRADDRNWTIDYINKNLL